MLQREDEGAEGAGTIKSAADLLEVTKPDGMPGTVFYMILFTRSPFARLVWDLCL